MSKIKFKCDNKIWMLDSSKAENMQKIKHVMPGEFALLGDTHTLFASSRVTRGYCIVIYHPDDLGLCTLINWECNTRQSELADLINHKLSLAELPKHKWVVYLLGGWQNCDLSKAVGEFLVAHFTRRGWQIVKQTFLTKQQVKDLHTGQFVTETESRGMSAIAHVLFDAKTQKLSTSSDWRSIDQANWLGDPGPFVENRQRTRWHFDTFLQSDVANYVFGKPLVDRDHYVSLRLAQIKEMIDIVKNAGNMPEVIVNAQISKMLMQGVLDINSTDENNCSLLYYAAYKQNPVMAVLLVSYGAFDMPITSAKTGVGNFSVDLLLEQNEKAAVQARMSVVSEALRREDFDVLRCLATQTANTLIVSANKIMAAADSRLAQAVRGLIMSHNRHVLFSAGVQANLDAAQPADALDGENKGVYSYCNLS